MRQCPACERIYTDETLNFCRADGAALVSASSVLSDAEPTVDLSVLKRSAETSLPLLHINPSSAVLPFVHMSADPDNEYFCDGLAEELLNALARIEGLKVAARTSAFSFKGKDVNISEIGRALNVSTVLEGSVRKSGTKLRVTAQLINVSDGYHLWSERYDRLMEDVFDIQDEITLAIVDALKVKLLGGEKTAVLKRHIENTEAYESYLKGRYYLNKFTIEGWRKAIEFFDEAIRLEPEYALAHAGAAYCCNGLWYYGLLPINEIVPRWKAAASRALEIDSNLSEAHLSLANIHFFYEWDWEAAEREFKRAMELNPNGAEAHWFYGMFLSSRERHDQAISEGRRALELDPLSLLVNVQVGWIYWLANRLEDALAQAQRIIEIEPNTFGAYWLRGGVYLNQGKHEEAIAAYEKAVALGGNNIVLSALGSVYGYVGRPDKALAILDQVLQMKENQYVVAFDVARVFVGLGENDLAFEWMDKACEDRNGELVFLNAITKVGAPATFWERFRIDPRFPDLLARLRPSN